MGFVTYYACQAAILAVFLPVIAYFLSWVNVKAIIVWFFRRFRDNPAQAQARPYGKVLRLPGGRDCTFIESATTPLRYTTGPVPGGFTRDLRKQFNEVVSTQVSSTTAVASTVTPTASAATSALTPSILQSDPDLDDVSIRSRSEQTSGFRICCRKFYSKVFALETAAEVALELLNSFWVLFQVLCYLVRLLLEFAWGMTKTAAQCCQSDDDPTESAHMDFYRTEETSDEPRIGFWGWFSPPPHFTRLRLSTLKAWLTSTQQTQHHDYQLSDFMEPEFKGDFIVMPPSEGAVSLSSHDYERRVKLVSEALSVDRKLRSIAFAQARRTAAAQAPSKTLTSASKLPLLPETIVLLSPGLRQALFPHVHLEADEMGPVPPALMEVAYAQPLSSIMTERLRDALKEFIQLQYQNDKSALVGKESGLSQPRDLWLKRAASTSSLVASILSDAQSRGNNHSSSASPGLDEEEHKRLDVSDGKEGPSFSMRLEQANKAVITALEEAIAEGYKRIRATTSVDCRQGKAADADGTNGPQTPLTAGTETSELDDASSTQWTASTLGSSEHPTFYSAKSLARLYAMATLSSSKMGNSTSETSSQPVPSDDDHRSVRSRCQRAELVRVQDPKLLANIARRLADPEAEVLHTMPIVSESATSSTVVEDEQNSPPPFGTTLPGPLGFYFRFWHRVGELLNFSKIDLGNTFEINIFQSSDIFQLNSNVF